MLPEHTVQDEQTASAAIEHVVLAYSPAEQEVHGSQGLPGVGQ